MSRSKKYDLIYDTLSGHTASYAIQSCCCRMNSPISHPMSRLDIHLFISLAFEDNY